MVEYCEIHFARANWYRNLNIYLQLLCLALSTLITITLIYFGTDHKQSDRVVLFTGSLAAFISAILSWSKFAQYDSLGASHEVAFGKYVDVCSKIETLFLKLRRFTNKFNNEAILEALDECMEEDEEEDDEDESSDDDSDSDNSYDGVFESI